MSSSTAVVWFRRDLRVADQPIFLAAADAADRALALFVLDPTLLGPAGAARTNFLYGCLRELDSALGGRLLVVKGDPADVVPRVAAAVGAGTVHIAADFGPYGSERDGRVEQALAEGDVELVRTGSPYAVAPGRVTKGDGDPFKVFTPFSRAWTDHGWRSPAETSASTCTWMDPSGKDGGPRAVQVPHDESCESDLPEPGEQAGLDRWDDFLDEGVMDYDSDRDLPAKRGTSGMSPYLKYGCVHPRTMLADLAKHRGDSVKAYRTEIAWREFYADVLHRRPDSARGNYDRSFDHLPLRTDESARADFERWQKGRTGFPIVDAGMRQLRAQAWMHNRVRMVVASFLVKDLHLPWWWGARHFMQLLVDGDLASNQHGWQWTAGSGTDASPYFRVFNPITQGERFDPDGDYVRRWVPELAEVSGKAVHQPWKLADGIPEGYPEPMVEHKAERQEALARYDAVKAAR
ncbi:cryptochrome/photolyase family protein [Pseudonocardia sp. HH130630-07]|uniref:cryptochrome/photolyase family protein n=1 Tax=Pseudonocardia sp. HH130630-07 TaxID=1690815 RepID=UPI000814F61C|nr:deoxyribodipyrimidine photo-lyase [Pseudonocardia sp. HH130630-07]ANY06247.1 deoxyribodipyrimidine photolyase [Pseudonocardia sp. HH130630-07]